MMLIVELIVVTEFGDDDSSISTGFESVFSGRFRGGRKGAVRPIHGILYARRIRLAYSLREEVIIVIVVDWYIFHGRRQYFDEVCKQIVLPRRYSRKSKYRFSHYF